MTHSKHIMYQRKKRLNGCMYTCDFYAAAIECIGFIINLLISLLILLIPLFGMGQVEYDKIGIKRFLKMEELLCSEVQLINQGKSETGRELNIGGHLVRMISHICKALNRFHPH